MKKITKYVDFLPFDLLNELQDFANDVNKMETDSVDQFTINKVRWEDEIVKESTPVKIYYANDDNIIINKVREEITNKTGWIADGPMMLYFWSVGSYIPWHNDGATKAGFTLYLNDFWDKDWGGLFLYEYGVDDTIIGITPEENIAVLQEYNVDHAITTINKDANVRITLQTFFFEKLEQ